MTLKLDAANSILRRTGIPEGWKEYSLGEVVKIIGGGTPDRTQSAYWRDGDIPWITPTDLTANFSKYISQGAEHISELGLRHSNATLVPIGSIIFSTRGTVGNMAIARVPVTNNQPCEALVPRSEEFSSEFIYYLLHFGLSAFHRLAGGTTFGSITRREIARVRFAFPPPEEQAAIVRILNAVDTAIDQAREAVESAHKMKASVVQEFFFRALGETAYADRPRRELPTGWALVPTETLLESEPKNGISPKASSQPPGCPTFSIAAIRHGKVDLGNKEHLKYAQLPEKLAKAYRVKQGNVLIVRGNANPDLIGKAAMVDYYPESCIYPDITKRVVFRQNGERTVTPHFAVLAWNHSIVHNQVLRRAKTSNGTLKINNRDVKQIVMPVPTAQEQTTLVKLTSALDHKIYRLSNVANVYEQLKRSLMHDLLTGKVRVNHLNIGSMVTA
jgi:type I restriction enzyme, S subunit